MLRLEVFRKKAWIETIINNRDISYKKVDQVWLGTIGRCIVPLFPKDQSIYGPPKPFNLSVEKQIWVQNVFKNDSIYHFDGQIGPQHNFVVCREKNLAFMVPTKKSLGNTVSIRSQPEKD